jgi:hypothetical protein
MKSAVDRREADVCLEVGLGNLGLLVERGHLSTALAAEVTRALVWADDQDDIRILRAVTIEVQRCMDAVCRIELAESLSPEARNTAMALALAHLRGLVGWKGRRHR